jgi:uncharacterized protein YegJ (DUF2314 family)
MIEAEVRQIPLLPKASLRCASCDPEVAKTNNYMRNFLFVLIAIFIAMSCNNLEMEKTKRKDEPTIYSTPSDDEEMNKAIAYATTTLPQFTKAFQSNQYDTSTFALKVRFATSTGGEHIWATHIRMVNGDFYGKVDNLPNSTSQVKLGEQIRLNQDDITDWMYAEKGVLKGGYTIKLLRSRMSEQERQQFDSGFSLKIVD